MFSAIKWGLYFVGVYRPTNILLIGLDSSGKSTFLERIKDNPFIEQREQTMESVRATLMFNDQIIQLIDMPGHKELRHEWETQFGKVHTILFFIDAANRSRLNEVRQEYEKIINDPFLKGIPIGIVRNKIDLEDTHDMISEEELKQNLNIIENTGSSRPQTFFNVSVKTKLGLQDLFNWIVL